MSTEEVDWDEDEARSMIGAVVLVGLTHVGRDEERHEQMYGTIISADAHNGFEIRLRGSREGEVIWLPPHMPAFVPALEGEYRLHPSLEIVADPDFTTLWRVEKPVH